MTQEEFLELCAEGDYEQVSEAISSGIDPNVRGKMGEHMIPPIFVAASSGNEGTIKALIEHGVNCADGFSAATAGHNLSIIKYLVDCGGDINAIDSFDHTPLLTAVSMNMVDLIEPLISLGADVNAKNNTGYTALTYAALVFPFPDHENIDPYIISTLMENGADYYEAMMVCVKTGNAEMARLLIQGGADVNVRDDDGRSFVMYSVMGEPEDMPPESCNPVLRVLLENGADPDLPDTKGRTPLMIAAVNNELDPSVIKTLLEFGADINATDDKGLTALMWAVAGVDKVPDIVMPALIRTGGLRADGWERLCAFAVLSIAVKHELQIDVVRRLINYGADVNIIDNNGMNALMYALMNGDDESADILSDAGAQINFDLN